MNAQQLSVVLALLAACPFAVAQEQEEEPAVLRIVDVRDLKATLLVGQGMETDNLLFHLGGANGINVEELAPGILSFWGTEAQQAGFAHQLRLVGALYAERYEVELACIALGDRQVPRLGAVVELEEPRFHTKQIVTRRQPTEVKAVTTHTYVAELRVITGDNAVGYEPRTRVVDEGLSLGLVIGAGEENARGTPLEARGELTWVSFSRMSTALPGRPDDPPSIVLPSVTRRTIQSAMRIEFGKLTAIAVVAGYEDSGPIVVAAAVRKLDER